VFCYSCRKTVLR